MQPRSEATSKVARKIRVPRFEQNEVALEDAGHLWAVSYADFLMVLLAFFVVFFSVDKDTKQNYIQQIMTSLPASGSPGTKEGGRGLAGAFGGVQGKEKLPSDLPQDLKLIFADRLAHSTFEPKKIVLVFEDDIYGLGQIELAQAPKAKLFELLEKLKPFSDRITIGFIGHTDNVALQQRQGRELANNYDLSVVRASRALGLAIGYGLNPENLYASGAGPQGRHTRSLTLVIKPVGGGLL